MSQNIQEEKAGKLGFFARRKRAIDCYVAIRKERSKEVRDYFASEGESNPKRLAAQRERDKAFLKAIKKIGIGVILFLVFYAILRTILGLW